MGKRLILLADGPMDPDRAATLRDQAQELLGMEVVIITGMRQAVVVETEDDDPRAVVKERP